MPMKKVIISALLLSYFFIPSMALAGPDKTKYQVLPFLSEGSFVPEVLLVLSKDHKMFKQAYSAFVDFDEDGFIDTGFNPSVVYYGYFDSYSCYQYSVSMGSVAKNGDKSGLFRRVGPTIDDQTTITRPSNLQGYIRSPRAINYKTGEKIGICQNPNNGGGYFSGNWLNYVATSRMDVIRKILYGGYRETDTKTQTLLESSFLPHDAHVWGYDVVSDDRWNIDTPLSAYYDISKYTPFAKPASNSAHFFARVRSLNTDNYPTIRYIENVNKTSFINSNITATGNSKQGRYWDWALDEQPQPADRLLIGKVQSAIKSVRVRVEVCKPDSSGNVYDQENCWKYGEGVNAVYKPVGLLQKHGAGDAMFFGLLTGSYQDGKPGHQMNPDLSKDYRHKGGVLRHNIDSISKSFDPQTGIFTEGGLIWTLESLRITGRPDDPNGAGMGGPRYYQNVSSWGNPIGEMLYEATRYFAGLDSPTTIYMPTNEVRDVANKYSASGDKINGFKRVAPPIRSWKDRPVLSSGDCAKPVILLISDIDSDYDGNDFPYVSDLQQDVLSGINFMDSRFNLKTYLDLITNYQHLKGGRYFYSTGGPTSITADCSAKVLNSLNDVNGICPNAPGFEGSYSVAAVAYYAHTHNFSRIPSLKEPIDIYAVTMSSAFPELTIPLYNSNGSIEKKITIMPIAMTNRKHLDNKDRLIGFINYYTVDWEVDRNGTPFRIQVKTNYDVGVDGEDYDMDVLITHTIELVTAKTTWSNIPVRIDSGELKGRTLYPFANPASIPNRQSMIEIDPQDVVGLVINSTISRKAADTNLGAGYSISGTGGFNYSNTRYPTDGTYLDVFFGVDGNFRPRYSTPKVCSFPQSPIPGERCGTKIYHSDKTTFTSADSKIGHSRSFIFASSSEAAGGFLPNPMWLAAKFGGFNDYNNNGIPDPGEWEGPDGNPKNYFQATNIAELPGHLEKAFKAIATNSSTGTATSASVNSILGGGISIQTLYYPEYKDHLNDKNKIKWVGSVMGLFVDRWGNLREDNYNAKNPQSIEGDGVLTLKTGKPGDPDFPTGDFIIAFEPGESDGPILTRYYDEFGNGTAVKYGEVKNYQQIKTVWNTAQILSENSISSRNVFYGHPESNGTLSLKRFIPSAHAGLTKFMIHDNTAAMLPSPGNNKTLTENLITYVLGEDIKGWRSRLVSNPWRSSAETCDPANQGKNGHCITWRLGDIINSKPIIVGAPAFNYDLLYNDSSYYDEYKKLVSQRRHVAYFGANDGMLHAVNLGFYGSLEDAQVGYKRMDNADYKLGQEIWAYIPTAVLPHLQWLADSDYQHSYYVDLKPLVADVKINGKWRTVLIGGLRLGGRAIESNGIPPYSYSEVFALDVTDPEAEPKLLWRYSADQLGLSVGLPVVVTRNEKWYVILASGPNVPLSSSGSPYNGESTQEARLIVVDAATGKEVVDTSKPEFENYLKVPSAESGGNSFFNESFVPMAQGRSTPWHNHAVYYGLTVTRSGDYDRGAVYRLQMTDDDPRNWQLRRLINTERPVTGAVNSTYDQKGNLWVFFGTGRMWWQLDMRPCVKGDKSKAASACAENHEQYFYGIKEPLDSKGAMRFSDQTGGKIVDVSGAKVFSCFLTGNGYVTNLVKNSHQNFQNVQVCGSQNLSGVPYDTLAAAIMSDDYIGYKRKIDSRNILSFEQTPYYEMVLTQPKLDSLSNGSSYMAYTTYEPPQVTCGDSGHSYLHMADTFTGLPAPYMYKFFSESFSGNASVEKNKQVPGYIEAGGGKSTEAIIMEASNSAIIRTSGQDSTIYDITIPRDYSQGSSTISWREVLDAGFILDSEIMTKDLKSK